MNDLPVSPSTGVQVLEPDEFPFLVQTGFFFQITNYRRLFGVCHSHTFFEILFDIEGSCTHYVNGVEYASHPSTLFVIRPGDVHALYDQTPDANFLALSIAEEEFKKHLFPFGEALYDELMATPSLIRYVLSIYQKMDLMEGLETFPAQDLNLYVRSCRLLLAKTALIIAARGLGAQTETFPERFLSALEEMRKLENASEGVSAFLRLSSYSHAQLCRLMKSYSRITPQQYVIQQRMNLAFQLLTDTTISVYAIAEMVGYSSYSHFSKSFQKHFGILPHLVRKTPVLAQPRDDTEPTHGSPQA